MMFFIYNLLFYLSIPFILFSLWYKGLKNQNYRSRIKERFGYFSIDKICQEGIWIHAVSVGEANIAITLTKILQHKYPNLAITITTTTPTGSELVKSNLQNRVFHVYAPYDLPNSVKRFLSLIKPKLVIILETEIWSNILHYCNKKEIPIVLVNGRLSEKSAKKYNYIKKFISEALKKFNLIIAQTDSDAERFINLGAPKNRIKVRGNIKFDILPPKELNTEIFAKIWPQKPPTFICASTHDNEEEFVLEAFRKIKRKIPQTLLILVPRHSTRSDLVAKICSREKFSFKYFSEIKNSQDSLFDPKLKEVDIIIGNTIGDLMTLYAISDVAFVGGSIVEIGGHNILEPAILKIPIITGPHLHNFRQIKEIFLAHNALVIVQNSEELTNTVLYYLNSKERCAEFGKRAYQLVIENRGALAQNIDLLQPYIEKIKGFNNPVSLGIED